MEVVGLKICAHKCVAKIYICHAHAHFCSCTHKKILVSSPDPPSGGLGTRLKKNTDLWYLLEQVLAECYICYSYSSRFQLCNAMPDTVHHWHGDIWFTQVCWAVDNHLPHLFWKSGEPHQPHLLCRPCNVMVVFMAFNQLYLIRNVFCRIVFLCWLSSLKIRPERY